MFNNTAKLNTSIVVSHFVDGGMCLTVTNPTPGKWAWVHNVHIDTYSHHFVIDPQQDDLPCKTSPVCVS